MMVGSAAGLDRVGLRGGLLNPDQGESARDNDGHRAGDGQDRPQPGGGLQAGPRHERGQHGRRRLRRCDPVTDPLKAITGWIDGLGCRVQRMTEDGLVVPIL
jgi:hypothetical protein